MALYGGALTSARTAPMPQSEERLSAFYEANRDEWVANFLHDLRAAGLKSYLPLPDHVLLPAVGKSMDLLVHCLIHRDPEKYVNSQRENFAQRIAQGTELRDITGGLDVAAQILNRLIEAALPANEVTAMKQRGSRYLLMTQTTLLELATAHGKA